jgi:2-hydroxy-6-oxo-6-(2'-aminophenyl)hexa-2,4-dienoate hydrolase
MKPSPYEKRFIDVNGIKTCYIEDGSGPPLLLVHGGGAGANSYGNWFACMPLFAKHFRTIAVDMVGFGDTDKPDGASFEYSQKSRWEHIAGFVKALGLEKASMVGNSMGGATVMGVAIEFPDLVDKLVLMGSAGLNSEITPALGPVLNYDFTKEGMIRLMQVLTNPAFEIKSEMVDYRWTNSVEPGARQAYAATMNWVRKQGGLFYSDDYIAKVQQPTFVVNGKVDEVVTLKQAARFLELIDNSWGYIMPHTGHWAMIEHPEDFSAAVTAFILSH